jgi:hypothetical protein
MVRVYDRPLLRSSARGDGALKEKMIAWRLDYWNPDARIRATALSVQPTVTQREVTFYCLM